MNPRSYPLFSRFLKLPLALLLLGCTSSAWSAWQLDNTRSTLNFVTIKAGNIAENHSFKQLSGSVDKKGNVSISINTASVDTLIPIRDDRMQEFLFETKIFPELKFTAQVNLDVVNNNAQPVEVNGQLTIKDRTIEVTTQVLVINQQDQSVVVASTQPILLNANQVGLLSGVNKLQELAGLPSISQAVPVNFVLTFTQ